MQIHELPNGTPTSSDYIPIDNGGSTRKTTFSGFEAGDNTATFTSGDTSTPVSWQSVPVLASGTIKSIFGNVSKMMANTRYIWEFIGSTALGTTATTITGAIAELVTKLGNSSMGTTATTITGAIAELRQMLTQSSLISTIPGLLTRGEVSDFNDATATGNYTYTSSALNRPPISAGGQFNVYRYSATYIVQEAFINSSSSSAPPRVFIRRSYSTGNWTDWFEFTIS